MSAGSRLAIVGAGPKAAAIAALASAMRSHGYAVPEIHIFESRGRAAMHWEGDDATGYTDGIQPLCNPAEKDIGYPYEFDLPSGRAGGPDWSAASATVFERFGWQRFQLEKRCYGDYVQRKMPWPPHRLWAEYVRWVLLRVDPGIVQFRKATVTRISPLNDRFAIDTDGGRVRGEFDGVVITGPGPAKGHDIVHTKYPRVRDAQSFWQQLGRFDNITEDDTIGIVGDGGGAGAIIAWLIRNYGRRRVKIVNISLRGTLFARGDGYVERRYFSNPSDWPELSLATRTEIMSRTEQGVISQQNKEVIDLYDHIEYRAGRAKAVFLNFQPPVAPELYISYEDEQGTACSLPCTEVISPSDLMPAHPYQPLSIQRPVCPNSWSARERTASTDI